VRLTNMFFNPSFPLPRPSYRLYYKATLRITDKLKRNQGRLC